jgi:hypothetical protein
MIICIQGKYIFDATNNATHYNMIRIKQQAAMVIIPFQNEKYDL